MKRHMNIKFLKTKSASLIIIFNLLLLGLLPFSCYSQDLYDSEHSRKYAEYLTSSHQYALAAEEYERLVYFDSGNVNFKNLLIKSYRLSGDLNAGIKRYYSFYSKTSDTLPGIMAEEFVRLELLNDSLSVAERFIQIQKNLSQNKKDVYQTCTLLINNHYSEADLMVRESKLREPGFPHEIISITEGALRVKLKSPALAAGFSILVPGTGKIYTKNWSDGVFAFLFVAGNAWQSYRGFHEHGIKSGIGWAFAGLSASFYIGNVFGAVKAAKRYNKNKIDDINRQVFDFVRSDKF